VPPILHRKEVKPMDKTMIYEYELSFPDPIDQKFKDRRKPERKMNVGSNRKHWKSNHKARKNWQRNLQR